MPPRRSDLQSRRRRRRRELTVPEGAADLVVVRDLSRTFREAVRRHGFKAAMQMLLESMDEVRRDSEGPNSEQR
jgi:hypothetical protein